MKTDREIWEDKIVSEAIYFTVIRYLGRSKYERQEHKTLQTAVDYVRANKNLRLMIYAVNKDDHSTMIGPKDYDRYLNS